MNPFVFIVGCPRSGTNLLRHILRAHPQLAVTAESHWIPVWYEKRRGLTPDGMVTPELIDRLLEHPGFAPLRMEREDLARLMADSHPLFYSTFVTGILDLYGKRRNKLLVGVRTPGYVRRMNTLHALWPMARFVHLVRDGRDVYLSMKHRPLQQPKPGVFDTWAEESALTAALWWELNVRAGRQAGNSLGPGLYYEIRYESLITHPREECEGISAFLGLPYDDAMLSFNQTQMKKNPGPITPGLRDWRTQMPAGEVERFEAAAGELLDELQYNRAVPHPRPECLETAARIRDLVASRSGARGRLERKEMSTRR